MGVQFLASASWRSCLTRGYIMAIINTCVDALTVVVFLKNAEPGRAYLFSAVADEKETPELLRLYVNDRLYTLGISESDCHIVTL